MEWLNSQRVTSSLAVFFAAIGGVELFLFAYREKNVYEPLLTPGLSWDLHVEHGVAEDARRFGGICFVTLSARYELAFEGGFLSIRERLKYEKWHVWLYLISGRSLLF